MTEPREPLPPEGRDAGNVVRDQEGDMSGDGVTGRALDFPELGENRRWAPPNEFADSILAGAGLTVHGAGYLSYPGEGLVRDGLSYMANTIHNI